MRTVLFGTRTDLLSALEASMKAIGHEVTVCSDMSSALEAVCREQPAFLVLSGPSSEGLPLCDALRREKAALTTLVAVEEHEDARLLESFRDGVDDYVIVPIQPNRLRVRLAFAERKAADRLRREVAEAALEVRIRRQAVFSELGRRALAGLPVQALMEYIVQATVRALEVDGCRVYETAAGTGAPVLRASAGAPGAAEWPPAASGGADPKGVWSVPIPGETGPFGFLVVYTRNGEPFQEEARQFLGSVAHMLAAVVERNQAEEALRESEAKASAIVETTVDAVISISDQGIIESFNAAAERIFGWKAGEVIGLNVNVLMPEPYRSEHDEYMHRYLQTGRRKIIGIGREVVGLRKSGETFPMDLAVSEIRFEDRRLFTGIIRDITERRQLETGILEAGEIERRRIGQDLHDGLGQMLTGIGLISRNLARKLEAENHPLARDFSEIVDLLREADQYARGLARGLVPVELDESGLAAALQRLALHAERLFGIHCVFEETGQSTLRNNTVATHLYRIAQEAVSNGVKHGSASRIVILLASNKDRLLLRVQDDGSGFPDSIREHGGMGVRIMHHRARMIGATLVIENSAGGGAVLTCTLPLRGNALRPRGRLTKTKKNPS